ncbi:MAG: FAD-binding oxidoreductase [Clostridia bacterium]|nr:FAD-binding oxidoreductase [Clostridia bacterium]
MPTSSTDLSFGAEKSETNKSEKYDVAVIGGGFTGVAEAFWDVMPLEIYL